MSCDKLNHQQMKDFAELASDRSGDAVLDVLQLVNDPAQAGQISTYVAARMIRLAAMFGHTASVFDGSNKSHDTIVAELTDKLTETVRQCQPTKTQIRGMEIVRDQQRLRRRN